MSIVTSRGRPPGSGPSSNSMTDNSQDEISEAGAAQLQKEELQLYVNRQMEVASQACDRYSNRLLI